MYVPKTFIAPSIAAVESYIRKNAFATLISNVDGLVGTHIPLLLSKYKGEDVLLGHVAVANQQAKVFDGKQELLAIFMQSHAYISSSWYDHVNVPTWNYIAVHINGTAEKIEGEELVDSINELVDQYEEGRPRRFHLNDFEPEERDAHLSGLIGFRMRIGKVEASFKLSQNRKENDYQEIIKQLNKSGIQLDEEIANEMKKLR